MSTWCDTIVNRLKNVNFTVVSIVTDPFVTQKFTMPKNSELIRIPLWGTEEPSEHLNVPFSSTYMAKLRTTRSVVQEKFLPIFDIFIQEILAREKDSERMGRILLDFYDFFRQYDYKVAFKSELTWERYKVLVHEEVEKTGSGLNEPDLFSLIQSLGWLYRFFNVINTDVPQTSLAHSTAAAFCGLPCVIAKLKYGTPFLLSEHGVYLREQYLSLSKRGYSSFLNTFLIRMIWTVTRLNFTFADQVSPVCEYNMRWERRITSQHSRIRVIYNGVDHTIFSRVGPRKRDRPTVVTVARIDPLKDIMTLILVANEVRKQIPDVQFLVYGENSVPEYHEQCVKRIADLALGSTVTLVGHVLDMATAYDSGDIVLQTSVSEAFPFSVIEAMFAGKPVVATNVGGVPEAVGDTGLLLNPGDVEGLANATKDLLINIDARLEMGADARRRALDYFTLDRMLNNYMRTYVRLSIFGRRAVLEKRRSTLQGEMVKNREFAVDNRSARGQQLDRVTQRRHQHNRRQLEMERAMALLISGYPAAASNHIRRAVSSAPNTPADVVKLRLMLEINRRLQRGDDVAHFHQEIASAAEEAEGRGQQLLIEKAFALMDVSQNDIAVRYFKQAIAVRPGSPATPFLMLALSRLFADDGEYLQAEDYFTKSVLLSELAR